MKRWIVSLAVLCACQSLYSQTKFFAEGAYGDGIGTDARVYRFGLYIETKVGLNTGIGTGVKYLTYDHLEPIESYNLPGAPEFYQAMSAYIGVPLEFNYHPTPRIQIKGSVSLLFYNTSLSNPVGRYDYNEFSEVVFIPDDQYQENIKKLDFDLGLAGSYTISRRFRIGFGITYAMLLRKREQYFDEWGEPSVYFDPEHIRLSLSTHFLLIRIKKKKI